METRDIKVYGSAEQIDNFKKVLSESEFGIPNAKLLEAAAEEKEFNAAMALKQVESGDLSPAEFMDSLLAEEEQKRRQAQKEASNPDLIVSRTKKYRSPMSHMRPKKKKRK